MGGFPPGGNPESSDRYLDERSHHSLQAGFCYREGSNRTGHRSQTWMQTTPGLAHHQRPIRTILCSCAYPLGERSPYTGQSSESFSLRDLQTDRSIP
ncbi:hypothetical protein NDI44_20400 [Trichocoleus sp. DQ-A3]|uniref:hypothetical protein n=1 Tax=Cyanophyceae TaxID=3028117 RepID=UPI001687AC84|nr:MULTISPECIES: hypothetical protein [unclassified Coleofasciculus]MBD1892324.1 hypothetical protein [Coleofasciculus sp. FACHB-SPT9]MBD1897485.1 hypothetical protein [Coleofasciculus sp. FACHB-129]MBD1899804.1 hypothetical protein [Coleofasciculus sp. FACHB-125]